MLNHPISRICLGISLLLTACIAPPRFPENKNCLKSTYNGLIILNEGYFGQDNSTLSYWDEHTRTICEDVFEAVNEKKMGDTGNALYKDADTLYVVMDYSQTIYKLQLPSLKLLGELHFAPGTSPRRMVKISNSKAYVTSLLKGKVFVFDPMTMELTGEIAVQNYPEGIAARNGRAFVACGNYAFPAVNNQLAVINTSTDEVEKYLTLPIDNPGKVLLYGDSVFVNCRGNYITGQDTGSALVCIHQNTLSIQNVLYFPGSIYNIEIAGNVLMGIRDADKNASTLSSTGLFMWDLRSGKLDSLILQETDFKPKQTGDYLYGLAYDAQKGNLYVAFSKSKKGFVVNPFMAITDSFTTGINPSSIVFCR